MLDLVSTTCGSGWVLTLDLVSTTCGSGWVFMLLALKRDRFRTSNVRGSAAALYAAKPQPIPALIIIRKLLTELSRALKLRSDSFLCFNLTANLADDRAVVLGNYVRLFGFAAFLNSEEVAVRHLLSA